MTAAAARPLVSVVVPLHNGGATIARTLSSISRQTWREIEVVVVDDGSTDDGPDKVRAAAARDPRIRLVRQENGGVAAARNFGAAAAAGGFLAFVDADDLWAPEKIELQMQALLAGGRTVGLAYTWAALIDAEDRIYSLEHRPLAEGWVLQDLCRANVVGNGSSPLIRREAFESVGGYDPSLRDRGAQGCEDLMIYLRLAEHYQFRVIRRHLTGYRVTQGNMSSDALRMLRSCELTLDAFRARYPEYEPEYQAHRRDMVYWLLARAMTTGPLRNAAALLTAHGFLNAFQLADRLGDLAWLTLKARTPTTLKVMAQKLLRQGGAFRPAFLEAGL
jgi:glycosyltransferase involved in cell wall biosynthesis